MESESPAAVTLAPLGGRLPNPRLAAWQRTEQPYSTPYASLNLSARRNALSQAAELQMNTLLEAEKIERRAVYRPGEVCRLLRISPTTLRQL